MSDIIKALILAFVEGFTEFLPVSSTGHLILVNNWIDFTGSFSNSFSVIIQFGAILSVLLLYFNRLNPFSKKKSASKRQETLNIWKKIIVGFLPAAVFGFLLDDFIDKYLFNPITVAIALFVWGIVIILLENRKKSPRFESVSDITYKSALLIGFVQCLAMIPGTSRSAATIIGAMLIGCSRTAAAEFSFFLAIPTMAGATTLKLLKSGISFTTHEWIVLAVGVVGSFIVALVVISFFMNYIKKKDFKIFAYYRILLSLLVFSYFMFLK